METKKIILPEGWEIDKVEGNEIILQESKSELPKTWEECIAKVKELEFINRMGSVENAIFDPQVAFYHKNDIPKGLGKQLLALCQLLVCREEYRQGWKPDWGEPRAKYCIIYTGNQMLISDIFYKHTLLSFQSKEICEKFIANFKDLIEQAKELI